MPKAVSNCLKRLVGLESKNRVIAGEPSFVKNLNASLIERGRRDTIFELAENMSLDDMMNALQMFINGQYLIF